MRFVKQGNGSAPGKIILTGEHSVVYGYPALAVSIDLRCHVTSELKDNEEITIYSKDLQYSTSYSSKEIDEVITQKLKRGRFDNILLAIVNTRKLTGRMEGVKVTISSQIPISAGLGSSAAVVVATIASIADLFELHLEKDKISEIAFESEKITHGKPSGIDNSIATFGGILRFEAGKITTQKLSKSIPILIGNTKVARNTKTLVEGVAELKNALPHIINPIFETIGSLVNEFEISLEKGQLRRIGELMNINQGLLDSIGVGHSSLSDLIWKTRESGSIGAKLTGAGGGGCMIALTENEIKQQEIIDKLEGYKFELIPAKISGKGVVIGSER